MIRPLTWLILSIMIFTAPCPLSASTGPTVERHVVVFGAPEQFGGWPANHGVWNWNNEILVGFSIGVHKNLGEKYHNIDRDLPEEHVLARSLDGGHSWQIEFPAKKGMLINQGGMRHGITDPKHKETPPQSVTKKINFGHPDFCMTMRFQQVHGGQSRLYYSYDRGHNWQGPYAIPTLGQPAIMARTDYIINGPEDCHFFLTASKQNKKEGRIICARTQDAGISWQLVGQVGPEPHGFAIMPATARLSANRLVMATRRREGQGETRRRWIDFWESTDNGANWRYVNDAVADVGEGNPPALTRLRDGRLCLTYGDRKPPYAMRARLSKDGGQNWSEPFTLRTHGAGRDMGYPRTVQRPDGKLVTIYYFYTADNIYRRVIATIWDAG
ncbi:MAG: exo-alpha-sialidase [Planctomycetaceae bacterium]|nr:exo-alpha-sialidase [Planctomycetaceae bacterium]